MNFCKFCLSVKFDRTMFTFGEMVQKSFEISNHLVKILNISDLSGNQKQVAPFDQALKSVEIYDPKLDQWSFAKPMDFARYEGAAVSFGEYIYIVGGTTGTSMTPNLVYSCEDDDYSTIPAMQFERRQFGATAAFGKIFVAGGFNSGKGCKNLNVFNVFALFFYVGIFNDEPSLMDL